MMKRFLLQITWRYGTRACVHLCKRLWFIATKTSSNCIGQDGSLLSVSNIYVRGRVVNAIVRWYDAYICSLLDECTYASKWHLMYTWDRYHKSEYHFRTAGYWRKRYTKSYPHDYCDDDGEEWQQRQQPDDVFESIVSSIANPLALSLVASSWVKLDLSELLFHCLGHVPILLSLLLSMSWKVVLSNNSGDVDNNELDGSAGRRLCHRNRVQRRVSGDNIQGSLRSHHKMRRAGVRVRAQQVLRTFLHGDGNDGAELDRLRRWATASKR